MFALFPYDRIKIDNYGFEEAPLRHAISWLQARIDNLSSIEEWIRFEQTRMDCVAIGLGPFIDAVLRAKLASETVKAVFYKRFWTLWLDGLHQSDRTLADFSGKGQDAAIEQFRKLDKMQIQNAQRRLRQRLLNARPSLGRSNVSIGETAILRRELNKQKRLKPLRQLFREIPNLLLALKPCLLMSPLSVAQFLDADLFEFDLVIFDEASQICSEDVVGSIVRGKQLIVVGDNKQLPPSSYFKTGSVQDFDTDEDEDEVDTDLYESVLDECEAIGLHSKMLRWHYRSRCEALIAFSNHHFYRDELVTFPGPYIHQSESGDRCIEFVYVPEGIYVRRKGTDKGTNRIEAQKVAELIFDHFTTHPEQSLGVIAFSETQMTAIDDAVRHLRAARPEYEKYFEEDGHEPFFIKNLENVQGDERDVIFISVGYGCDDAGKLKMFFGPLSKAGGERRLNVAITRAKSRVKLICSVLPQGMDVSGTKWEGPKLLKNYMEFAQNGPTTLTNIVTAKTKQEFDTSFEAEVCRTLQERGLIVHSQVGCSDYRIDLAVLDDTNPERYLLGIECDGQAYHASKTARDRDRLRQMVLERLGWHLVRIWSSDWVRDRETQIKRIFSAIADAQTAPTDIAEPLLPSMQQMPGALSLSKINNDISFSTTKEPLLESKNDTKSNRAILEGVTEYTICNVQRQGNPADFYHLADFQPEVLQRILEMVVKEEGPIHIMAATRRVIAGWNMGKAGSKLVESVKMIAERAAHDNEIKIQGEFLWPPNVNHIVVRVPAKGDKPRDIEEIPLEEIAEAACICIKQAFGINQNDLKIQTARLLGYNRTGSQVGERIDIAIETYIQEKRIKRNGESLLLQ